MAIESGEFRMGSGNFAKTLIFRYAAVWLAVLCATAVTGLALGIAVDLRWFVAGMMTVFIIIPGLLAFFYYSYGLRRECFINAVNHSLLIEATGITARIYIAEDKTEDESDTDSGETGTQGDAGQERRFRDEFFPYSDMKALTRNINSSIVTLRAPHKGFIWIPESAFEDIEVYSDVFRTISDGIAKHRKS